MFLCDLNDVCRIEDAHNQNNSDCNNKSEETEVLKTLNYGEDRKGDEEALAEGVNGAGNGDRASCESGDDLSDNSENACADKESELQAFLQASLSAHLSYMAGYGFAILYSAFQRWRYHGMDRSYW